MTGDGRDGTGSGGTGGSPGFDVSVAHPARVYNFLLGGKDNFAADREATRQMIAGGAKVLVGQLPSGAPTWATPARSRASPCPPTAV